MTRDDVGKFLKTTSLVGALTAFFVFAAGKWIQGVEAEQAQTKVDVSSIKIAASEVRSEVKGIRVEMASFAREIISRLDRIERKADSK